MSIRVSEVSFSYGAQPVLDHVSFEIGAGRLLTMLGPNGVGKTTLFKCMLGLRHDYRGSISLAGQDIRTLSPRELAHRVAYIPQSRGQAFNYSVLDMVLMGTAHLTALLAMPRQRELDAAQQAMQQVGVSRLAEKSFCHLSGGEQQLVLIARALAQQAKILLMDEPTAHLDYGNQTRVMEQVRQLADQGYTVLVSTHDPQHALWYADETLALWQGRVLRFGPSQQVVDAELMQQLYNVQVRIIGEGRERVVAPLRSATAGGAC